jgi:hypothetical protein
VQRLVAERLELEAALAGKNSTERKRVRLEASVRRAVEAGKPKQRFEGSSMLDALEEVLSSLPDARPPAPVPVPLKTTTGKGAAAAVRQFSALTRDASFGGKNVFAILRASLKGQAREEAPPAGAGRKGGKQF